ncbi:MAG: hypothetical protein HYZ57_02845 [Acidobacteria bacterium]|nr:hypothetical protein [Acidobacteriota bacterium]
MRNRRELRLVENDITFRCRGTLGSAWVRVEDATVYTTTRVFRLEHHVQNVKISRIALGEGAGNLFDNAPGPGEGFEYDKTPRKASPLAPWPYRRTRVRRAVAVVFRSRAFAGMQRPRGTHSIRCPRSC